MLPILAKRLGQLAGETVNLRGLGKHGATSTTEPTSFPGPCLGSPWIVLAEALGATAPRLARQHGQARDDVTGARLLGGKTRMS